LVPHHTTNAESGSHGKTRIVAGGRQANSAQIKTAVSRLAPRVPRVAAVTNQLNLKREARKRNPLCGASCEKKGLVPKGTRP
jgi:hypothetical protein